MYRTVPSVSESYLGFAYPFLPVETSCMENGPILRLVAFAKIGEKCATVLRDQLFEGILPGGIIEKVGR
jgi:hypothetical protein